MKENKFELIYYEGLFGNIAGWLYRNEIRNIEKLLDVKAKKKFWWWRRKKKHNNKNLIIIGHSFGAAAALRDTEDCALMITFDVRNGKDKFYKNNGNFKHINYYQDKPLRGYPVQGAVNVQVEDATHMNITNQNFALDFIKEWLSVNKT